MPERSLLGIYRKLRGRFGFRNWWPGETKDEIVIGAMLAQQAAWRNVEAAILNLKRESRLSLSKIARTDLRRLEWLVRPSGFYRQKSRRLKRVASYLSSRYPDLGALSKVGKDALRSELLSLDGIGKETADSIALYVAGKPTFVVDAYTRRAMHRLRPEIAEDMEYDALQDYLQAGLRKDIRLYKDFHAQFVELGKRYCRAKPACAGCPLGGICAYARSRD